MQAAARVDHFMAVEGRQTCSLDDNWFVSTLGLPPWQLELSPCAPAESLAMSDSRPANTAGHGNTAIAIPAECGAPPLASTFGAITVRGRPSGQSAPPRL